MNRLYITILFALFAIVCQGQNIRQNSNSGNIRESPNIRPDLPINPPKKPEILHPKTEEKHNKLIKDTVYATGTIKQHGWFGPQNIISKEAASHRSLSYRFTNRNKNGKWLKMEAMNAYGDYFLGAMRPYILKNSDDSIANQEWVERIKTSCIYEFVPDPTGMNVIQERAYDKDNNIVYVYSRTSIGEKNGKKMFIGSYKDSYGLPAEMRPEKGFSYGTLVLITEDKWGNDSIVEYIDSKGAKKLNADLADKEYFIYDKDANLIMQQSRDSVGNLIIDKFENCGILFTYDERNNINTATFMNDKWQPMHLPNKTIAGEKTRVQRIVFKYDEYDRQIEQKFVDTNGMDEENAYGCHKICNEYDDNGNLIKQTGYNLKGELSPITISGTAIENYVYDQYGRMTYASFFDKKQKPCRTDGYLSKIKREYDEKGNEVLVENYSAETGEEKLCYQMISKPNYKYTLWNDGTSRIDSLDSKGRTTFVGFYGSDGKFEMFEGRAYERYKYIDEIGKSTTEEIDYDTSGNKIDVDGICRTVTLTDSTIWTNTKWRYDSNDVLKETFIQRYTPGFQKLLALDDANSFGIVSRSGGSSSVRFFKGNVMYNLKGEKITHLYGVDEFGEPDYITTYNSVYYYMRSGKYYDINNKVILDDDSIMNALPKVMTIEVTDSSAYALGLRDNDIILAYGDYAVDLDSIVSYQKFKQEWTIRSVIDATKEKRMVVFRITDASKNEYGLYEIKGLKGTCSELGFLPHIRYLTDKQLNRIKSSVEKEINSQNPIVTYNDLKKINNKGGSHYVLLAYTEMYRSVRNKPYPKQVTDPSILLGTCIKDRNLKWTKEDGSSSESFETMLASRKANAAKYPRQDFFMTTDGKSQKHLILEENDVVTSWSDAYISEEDYIQLSAIYDNALDSINSIMKQRDIKNRKTFVGNWISQPNDSLQDAPKAFLCLSKDGKFEGQTVNYGQIHFTEGDAVYKIVKSLKGRWDNSDNWLFFYPENDSILLSCVDLLGAESDDLRQRAVDYMNSICESDKWDLLQRMTYDGNKISGDFSDVSINKNMFEAKLPSGNSIVFNKTKENVDLSVESYAKDNDNLSEKEIKAIDESCPYIGSWQCKLPGVDKSNVEFELSQSGELGIDLFAVANEALNDSCSVDIILDINVKGSWNPTDNGMRFDIDTEQFNIDTDFVLHSIDDFTKVEMLTNLQEEINSQKHEMGLLLLKGFMNEMVVTEVDTVKMVMNGNEFSRIPSLIDVVIGKIEGETGYLVEHGFSGLFFVLEWCDWNCRYGIDEFSEEFNKQKDNKKHIMLLPVETKDGKDVFKDVIELDVPSSLLGIRLMDQNVGRLYCKYNVLKRYKDYKKTKSWK